MAMMGESSSTKRKTARLGVAEQSKVIMEAAVDLFIAQGSQAVSVSAICQQAQVSRDTYYRCFKDKDELIDGLYQESINEPMLATLNAEGVDFCDPDWLYPAVDKTVDAILEDHRYARLLFVEAGLPNSHAAEVINQAYAKVARRMQRWCRDRGVEKAPLALFISTLFAVQWLVHEAINKGMSKAAVRDCKRAVAQQIYGVFYGLLNPPG